MGSRGGRKQRWHPHPHHHPPPLTPLMEGPDFEMHHPSSKKESPWELIREWFGLRKGVLRPPHHHHHPPINNAASRRQQLQEDGQEEDLRLLLGVLACPLAPIPLPLQCNINNNNGRHSTFIQEDPRSLLPPIHKHIPIETCTAHYIIQQYLAATGWSTKKQNKMTTSNKSNMYVAGTLGMSCCRTEVSSSSGGKAISMGSSTSMTSGNGIIKKGCFVVWQMTPGMWSLELVVGGNKVLAGSDSKIVWRHTPWLGTHVAEGPLRPLRRIIQGLDPKITASLFAGKAAQCMGEKRIGEEDCFVVKVAADRAERNDGPAAQVIRHVLYGYFSQRSGLLIYLEDSHLTRVLVQQHHLHHSRDAAAAVVYWETTIGSSIGDYRDVDGVLIAHQGRTVATVLRFGETSSQHCRSTMEEVWTIHDVVFDVPGLSADCFIPPADIWDGIPCRLIHHHSSSC